MSIHKLLLADDSITIQKVVNLTFADEGIEVISVSDGTAAMEKFVEAAPDLVMVDVNMPGVDGYRICELIKQDEKTKNVPVILLVGSFEPFDEEEARRVGANDYLTKPFQSIRQLVNKVTVLLNRSNDNGATEERSEPAVSTGASAKEVMASAEPVALELGDAGMDDEMIETDHIGVAARIPDSEPLTIEGSAEPGAEGVVQTADAGTAAESTVDGSYSEIRDFSSDRAAQLEEQMISEFGFDGTAAPVTEDFEAPRLTSPEDYFAPREITLEEPPEPEEIVQETGYAFDAEPEGSSYEPVSSDWEGSQSRTISNDDAGLPDSIEPVSAEPDSSIAQPVTSEWGTSQSQAFDSDVAGLPEAVETDVRPDVREISVDSGTSATLDVARDADTAVEQEELSEPPAAEDLPPPMDEAVTAVEVEGESSDRARETAALVQEGTSEPFAGSGPDQSDEIERSDEIQAVSPLFEAKLEYPPAFEKDQANAQDVPAETTDAAAEPEETAVSHAELPDIAAAIDQTGFPVPDFASTLETFRAEEDAELREEPSAEEPESIPQEAAEIAGEEPGEAHTGDAQPAAPEEIKSLVSNKDRTDAVESVIVSEFARHSVSLSSEAVETIAARIAEKISEKIIQEMASEVVSDLADLIVERMERKRRQE